ncbi:MAG: hypothetical protein EP332_10120 [Bacteroidetes bacterium]|nr:MAG: hypothetical protein EP332_10120 [Bacteroidota bacterium]
MKSPLILVLSLLVSLAGIAQPYKQKESNNIRIDPEWVSTLQSGDFCWAFDIALDAKGNSYSTGYFQKTLSDSTYSSHYSCRGSHCQDELFVAKRDTAGKLLWVVQATKHIRPARILVEPDGNVLLTGFLMGDTMKLIQADGQISLLPRGQKTGIYLVRLSPDGILLKSKFLSENEEQVTDMALDTKGNIYLSGMEQFRRAHKRVYVQNRLMVMKLSSDWNLEWRHVADTLGNSAGHAITVVGSTVYVGGSFSDTLYFQNKRLTYKQGNQRPALLSLNKKGKADWLIDSIGERSNYIINSLAHDSKGNIYLLAGSSHSYSVVSKITRKGKIKWTRNINGRGTVYSNRLLINSKDELFLCGESYGALFGSGKTPMLTYKTFGSTDPFIASYSSDGDLRWLKVYGGKTTDYCKSIAVSDQYLHTFGWTNSPFRFYGKETPGRRGYLFYEAKFSLEKLAYWDQGENKPFEAQMEKWPKFSATDCTCETKPNKKLNYANSVSSLISLDEFKIASDWQVLPHDSFFKYLFFTGLQTSSSMQSTFYSFNLVSFRPVQLQEPNGAYSIELNPCTNQQGNRHSDVTVSVEFPLHGHAIEKLRSKFDSSANAYLDILYTMKEADDEEWLYQVLSSNNLKKYHDNRAQIKSMFGIKLLDYDNEEAFIGELLKQLEKKKISVVDFTVAYLITGELKRHALRENEIIPLEILLMSFGYEEQYQELTKILKPWYRYSMRNTQVGLRFAPLLLHEWDSLKNEASRDSLGNLIGAYALIDAHRLEYESKEGLRIQSNAIYAKHAEIGTTGVLLQMESFRIASGMQGNNGLYASDYPLLLDKSYSNYSRYNRRYGMVTPLDSFVGIVIQNSSCKIPFENRLIPASGTKIAVNESFLSGYLYIDVLSVDTTADGQEEYTLGSESDPIKYTKEGLRNHFKSLGFTDAMVNYLSHRKQLIVNVLYRKPE